MTCPRCNDTQKLRSGADCPGCTHVIDWHPRNYRAAGSRAIATMHLVTCSCGWRHMETSRQNALGRASKMRGAVNKHLKEVEHGTNC